MEYPLGVWLNDAPVGQLNMTRNDGCEFRLLESYKNAYPRPILGQQFLDDPDHVHSSRQRTPPWFSNLLPKGPLRQLIARQAGFSLNREFFLLHHLGEDLPGAVRIVAAEAFPEDAGVALPAADEHPRADDWHFSLAGVQLKSIQYQADDQLALNLARSKRRQDVTRESFLRLARKIGEDETRMADRLEHARDDIMTAWHASRGDLDYTTQARERISHHLARVPLFSASA